MEKKREKGREKEGKREREIGREKEGKTKRKKRKRENERIIRQIERHLQGDVIDPIFFKDGGNVNGRLEVCGIVRSDWKMVIIFLEEENL